MEYEDCIQKAERKDVRGTKGLHVSAVGGKGPMKDKAEVDAKMERLTAGFMLDTLHLQTSLCLRLFFYKDLYLLG